MVARLLTVLLFFLCITSNVCRAELVITEVMSNEPGDEISLQWVEIYNNSINDNEYLSYYYIRSNVVNSTQLEYVLLPGMYTVIVVQTVSDIDSRGFEEVWGNGNGVWNPNDPGENYELIERNELDLPDSNGWIELVNVITSEVVSTFTWTGEGLDGVSWERQSVSSDVIGNSTDPAGGTPGRSNSITPRYFDLAINDLDIEPVGSNMTQFRLEIANVGLRSITQDFLTISYDPDADGYVLEEDFIGSILFPDLEPDEMATILVSGEIDDVYNYVTFTLPEDDWPNNNTITDIAPGVEFPPVILNEILADPKAPLASEWVEIKNRLNEDIDLNGWSLGNADILYPLMLSELILPAGEYLVLCKDSLAFVDYYGESSYIIREPVNWPTLRNDEDNIRLLDTYNYMADSFYYDDVFGGNVSWGRSELSDRDGFWGKSKDGSSTPGEQNDIFLAPSSETIEITTEPNPFSYSKNDAMSIDIAVPDGESMSVRIYDRDGRVVKSFIENMEPFDDMIEWDGLADNGQPLPPGIYILYAEVSGSGSVKQTVVLSP